MNHCKCGHDEDEHDLDGKCMFCDCQEFIADDEDDGLESDLLDDVVDSAVDSIFKKDDDDSPSTFGGLGFGGFGGGQSGGGGSSGSW